jgi:hypothetical protein
MSITTLALITGLLGPFTVTNPDNAPTYGVKQANETESLTTASLDSTRNQRGLQGKHQVDWYDLKIRAGEELEIHAIQQGTYPANISVFEPGSKAARYTFDTQTIPKAFRRIAQKSGTYRIRIQVDATSTNQYTLKTKINRVRNRPLPTEKAPHLDFLTL